MKTTTGVATAAEVDEPSASAFSAEVTMTGDARREIIDSGGMTPPRRNRGILNIARESGSGRWLKVQSGEDGSINVVSVHEVVGTGSDGASASGLGPPSLLSGHVADQESCLRAERCKGKKRRLVVCKGLFQTRPSLGSVTDSATSGRGETADGSLADHRRRWEDSLKSTRILVARRTDGWRLSVPCARVGGAVTVFGHGRGRVGFEGEPDGGGCHSSEGVGELVRPLLVVTAENDHDGIRLPEYASCKSEGNLAPSTGGMFISNSSSSSSIMSSSGGGGIVKYSGILTTGRRACDRRRFV